jgi:hypothetical protein
MDDQYAEMEYAGLHALGGLIAFSGVLMEAFLTRRAPSQNKLSPKKKILFECVSSTQIGLKSKPAKKLDR